MRILLVDDDVLVLNSLKAILSAQGFDVVGEAAEGEEAVEKYMALHPEVVLMDIRMEPKDGIYGTEEILKRDPQAKILLLTTFNEEEYIDRAMALGAGGYILKQNFKDLPAAIKAVGQGNIVFDKEVISKKFKGPKTQDLPLTPREFDIVRGVSKGLNNREIAEKLFLSEGTVRNYLSGILDKLNLRDRTQVAVFYYKHLGG